MSGQDKQQGEMSFWEHLDVLRGTLIKIISVLVIFTVVFFLAMPTLFDKVILAPCRGDFWLYRMFERITQGIPFLPQFATEGFEVQLINIKLASQLFIHMSASFWLALVFSFPLMLYFIWDFVKPALYDNEVRGARKAFVVGNVMFFIGVAVGYFVVFPVTLRFLADYQASELVPNQISLDSYMDTFLMLIFMLGVVFELPLLAWALGAAGVLHREFFGKYRRHAIVALLIVAAVITPTSDPFTLCVVFLPLYMLYEVSALFVKPEKRQSSERTVVEK